MVRLLLGVRAVRVISPCSFVRSLFLDKDYNAELEAGGAGQPLPSRSGPFPCLPFLPGTTQPPTSHRAEEHQEGTSWPPTRHRRSSICAILSNGWDERGPSLRWLPLLLLPQAPALSIHRPRSPAPSFSLFLSFILTLAEMPQHHPGSLVCGMVMLS